MSAFIDAGHRFFSVSLEFHDIEAVLRIQNINQMMWNSLHLLWHDLRRTDIKMAVYLYGIGRYDLSSDVSGKLQGKCGFANCSRSGQYD